MNIHESAEDYLEAILRLKEAKGYARSVDISLLLGVTKPSVSAVSLMCAAFSPSDIILRSFWSSIRISKTACLPLYPV